MISFFSGKGTCELGHAFKPIVLYWQSLAKK
jgi:hypothetical protein